MVTRIDKDWSTRRNGKFRFFEQIKIMTFSTGKRCAYAIISNFKLLSKNAFFPGNENVPSDINVSSTHLTISVLLLFRVFHILLLYENMFCFPSNILALLTAYLPPIICFYILLSSFFLHNLSIVSLPSF